MAKYKGTPITHNQYPLAELLTLSITKPVHQFTSWDHLLVGQVLEELKRVQRQSRRGAVVSAATN